MEINSLQNKLNPNKEILHGSPFVLVSEKSLSKEGYHVIYFQMGKLSGQMTNWME